MPPGIDAGCFKHLIEHAERQGIRRALDADGEVLKQGLQGKPFLIKPNQYELERWVGHPIDSAESIVDAARSLIHEGLVQVVVTSRAEEGALLITKDTVITGKAPAVQT